MQNYNFLKAHLLRLLLKKTIIFLRDEDNKKFSFVFLKNGNLFYIKHKNILKTDKYFG
jgi:hypothetical protein